MSPFLFFQSNNVTVWVHADRFVAHVARNVGNFTVNETVERAFPHIEDLHGLSLRGVHQLALEFYNELKQTITN